METCTLKAPSMIIESYQLNETAFSRIFSQTPCAATRPQKDRLTDIERTKTGKHISVRTKPLARRTLRQVRTPVQVSERWSPVPRK